MKNMYYLLYWDLMKRPTKRLMQNVPANSVRKFFRINRSSRLMSLIYLHACARAYF